MYLELKYVIKFVNIDLECGPSKYSPKILKKLPKSYFINWNNKIIWPKRNSKV